MGRSEVAKKNHSVPRRGTVINFERYERLNVLEDIEFHGSIFLCTEGTVLAHDIRNDANASVADSEPEVFAWIGGVDSLEKSGL